MSEIIELYSTRAIAKIEEELASLNGNQYAKAVGESAAAVLCNFCDQNQQFAKIILETKRTFSDVLFEMFKDFKDKSISDIDVYRGVIQNYFPNAEVNMIMRLELNGPAPSQDELDRVVEKPEPKKYEAPKFEPPKPKTPEEIEEEKKKAADAERERKEAARKKKDEESGQLFWFDML